VEGGVRVRKVLLVVSCLALWIVAGCGGTWVDDERNFKRVFDFNKPQDVTVVHSYYWKSSHWSTEYRYFIALRAPLRFVERLTDAKLMTPKSPDEAMVSSCGDRPQWFLTEPLTNYEAWIPKSDDRYRVFRDKTDGIVFVCDQRL
jgi:hypothetical protein